MRVHYEQQLGPLQHGHGLKYFKERFYCQSCQQWGDRSDRETWLAEVKQKTQAPFSRTLTLCSAQEAVLTRPNSEQLGSNDSVTVWARRPGKLLLYHTTIIKDPEPPEEVASRCPELLEGAWLPSVTYSTQKPHCVPSFRIPPITDRLCWCLTPEPCSLRSHFCLSAPNIVVWPVPWRHFHMTVLASNSTGLLHGTRTSSKGSIYMAHPACFCLTLPTSGVTDSLQWGISPPC